jgi:polyribonucleotide nucleotidyltransferase
MEHMLSTLSAPRTALSQYAPKIDIKIPVERIGELIGPGGKIIKAIIADSGAQVDVEDDGSVFITAIDADAIHKARTMIEGMMKEVYLEKNTTVRLPGLKTLAVLSKLLLANKA